MRPESPLVTPPSQAGFLKQAPGPLNPSKPASVADEGAVGRNLGWMPKAIPRSDGRSLDRIWRSHSGHITARSRPLKRATLSLSIRTTLRL